MTLPIFIGDEVNACGYRLAGLRVRVPDDADLLDTIRLASEQAPLVLIDAATAQRLPAGELQRLLARIAPPIVIVPDLHGQVAMPDLTMQLRQQLGMLE